MARVTVVFQPEGRRTQVGPREDLLDAARRCGVGLEDLCAGRGTCGKCKVLVRKGEGLLTPPRGHELHLDEEDRRRGTRLACQARVRGDGQLVLEVPPEAQRGRQRLQTSGYMPRVRLHPSVRLGRPPRGPARQPGARSPRIPVGLRAELARAGPSGRLVLWEEREVLGVQRARTPLLGMAFDIGSTKIAGFLVDLTTGEVLETVSAPNPQMVHGEDIMSRLAFSIASEDQRQLLHRIVIDTISDLVRKACALARHPPESVVHITAVGNTVMHHLFLGLPTDGLARAPYRPALRKEATRPASRLGIRARPKAKVTAPPVVAGFVGSDLVAGVLATRMHRGRGLQALVDVGTNTEICAGGRDGLLACSSPSGPAFEGAHIRFGMRAADGAIERISLDPDTFEVHYRTIGNEKPRGLCGSALIDLLADLRRAGALDGNGQFRRARGPDRFREKGGETTFIVVPSEETAIGQDIVLTQGDVGQLQFAKAAVHAGLEILLDELGARAADLRALHIAGAFGTYVAPESARTLGMFPDLPLDRIRFVGNTAGSGARLALVSRDERGEMARLARTIRHVSLAGDPRFSRAFAGALGIPHRDASRFPTWVRHFERLR